VIGAQAFSGLDIEALAMERAFNLIGFQDSVGHVRLRMGADVAGRIILTFETVDGDLDVPDR
jgi:hypothetical protein